MGGGREPNPSSFQWFLEYTENWKQESSLPLALWISRYNLWGTFSGEILEKWLCHVSVLFCSIWVPCQSGCSKKKMPSQALVAHTCNPNYLGGRDQEDQGSKLGKASIYLSI
jgi:hypothetical protein